LNSQKITKNFIKKHLPSRGKNSNKTDGGRVLIVGGGKGLYGAGLLSALAATKSGAGYTHLMTDLSRYPWLRFPDFIVHPLKLSELKKKETFVVAIGPGLGTQETRKSFINFLLKNDFKKVILDADALTLLSTMKFKSLPESWILTPHEGELARLIQKSSHYVKLNRVQAIKEAHKRFGCIVILKGPETLVTDSSNKIYSISAGTRSLAKAGTGDTLLGIIAALYAQGVSPLHAALLGPYIHGQCAREWEKKNDHLSLRPVDLIDLLPKVLRSLR